MSQVVCCPHCQGQIQNNPTIAGQVVGCPLCRQQFQMPGMSVLVPATMPVVQVESPLTFSTSSYIPRRAKKSNSGVVVATLVVLALAGGAFGAWKFYPDAFTSIWRPGRISISITWKYNEVLGHRGDAGARVLVFPIDTQDFKEVFGPGETPHDRRARNAYFAKLPGDGKTTITNVRPGRYHVYVVSENTRCDPKSQRINEKFLKPLLWNGGTESYYKLHVQQVEVRSGEEEIVSHDFGVTDH